MKLLKSLPKLSDTSLNLASQKIKHNRKLLSNSKKVLNETEL